MNYEVENETTHTVGIFGSYVFLLSLWPSFADTCRMIKFVP